MLFDLFGKVFLFAEGTAVAGLVAAILKGIADGLPWYYYLGVGFAFVGAVLAIAYVMFAFKQFAKKRIARTFVRDLRFDRWTAGAATEV